MNSDTHLIEACLKCESIVLRRKYLQKRIKEVMTFYPHVLALSSCPRVDSMVLAWLTIASTFSM